MNTILSEFIFIRREEIAEKIKNDRKSSFSICSFTYSKQLHKPHQSHWPFLQN